MSTVSSLSLLKAMIMKYPQKTQASFRIDLKIDLVTWASNSINQCYKGITSDFDSLPTFNVGWEKHSPPFGESSDRAREVDSKCICSELGSHHKPLHIYYADKHPRHEKEIARSSPRSVKLVLPESQLAFNLKISSPGPSEAEAEHRERSTSRL